MELIDYADIWKKSKAANQPFLYWTGIKTVFPGELHEFFDSQQIKPWQKIKRKDFNKFIPNH